MTHVNTRKHGGKVILKSPRSRTWCFTVNNPTLEFKIDTFTQLFTEGKFVVGLEKGDSKTEHWQGYVQFKNARTFASMKKILPTAHLEKAKGGKKANYIYCTKDNNFLTNMDMIPFKQKIKNLCKERYKDIKWKNWQKDILDILKEKPDDRTVNWFWENSGNIGKSFLAKYICINYDTVIADGKKDNIFNQINIMMEDKKLPHVIILDIPRHNLDFVNYGAIEQIKNGLIYSGKYEGGICIYPPPHVIIFANEGPIKKKFSKDRWNITEIK